MKGLYVALICSLIICSCNTNKSKENKNTDYPKTAYKYLTSVLSNTNDSVVMYTDDGHLLSYSTDSLGNYIVNYAKFDYNAGGYETMKDKLVRVELDSSMKFIRSIVSVYGVSLCFEDNGMYDVTFYDEQMHQEQFEDINVRSQIDYNTDTSNISKVIIMQLLNAYDISHYIYTNKENGLYSISSALEPICFLSDYEIIEQEKVYDQKIKDRLPRFIKAAEGLTHFRSRLNNIK